MKSSIFYAITLALSLSLIVYSQESEQVKVDRYEKAKRIFEANMARVYSVCGEEADTNGDGVVDLVECRGFLATDIHPKANTRRFKNDGWLLRIILRKNPDIDMNGNGHITKGELLRFMDECIYYTQPKNGN